MATKGSSKGVSRSYNNADLTVMQVQGFKKKAERVTSVQFRIGSRKVNLPVEAHFLASGPHAFLSIQTVNAVLGTKADGSFEAVLPKEKDEAVIRLKAVRAAGRAAAPSRGSVELDEEGKKALAKIIPSGYKLVLKGDGYSLVKARTRKPKK